MPVWGNPVVDADSTCTVSHNLQQATSHDQVFDEVEDLIGIGEICMEAHCRGETKQREHNGDEARLIAKNDKKAAPHFDHYGPRVRQWRR